MAMTRWLCNAIIRALLPHSDYGVEGDSATRALAILELAQVLSHAHDAIAFLGARPGRYVTNRPGRLTCNDDRPGQAAPVIRHLTEHRTAPPTWSGWDRCDDEPNVSP